ncbi:MAG TPA: hypothetical protein VFY29_04760 [Terriglobia bacterium]|nr:hypothetical protein [Terriglobia bacterium]
MNRLLATLFQIESNLDRLKGILPAYVTDPEDRSGNLRTFMTQGAEDSTDAEIRESIFAFLEMMALQTMGIMNGQISPEDLEQFADRFQDTESALPDQLEMAAALLNELRPKVLAVGPEQLSRIRFLTGRLFITQIHKDLNEGKDELRVPGLPPSAAVYHTGDTQFGLRLAWFGDELKIVGILID